MLVTIAAVFVWRTSVVTTDGRTFTLFDDAMVSMRYARNLAEGHGLVYNPGRAPVEGYTNFLWTLWMAALHVLPVPTRFVPLLVSTSGAALLAAGVALVGRIARRLAPDAPGVVAIVMWATALYYPLIFWTLRGLEPGLLSVLIQSAVLLAWSLRDEPTTRRAVWLAAVLVAGVLTRTDFALLAGGVIFWLAAPGVQKATRRATFGVGLAVALALAAHTLFELAYYGDALPNTYTLKLGGVGLGTRLSRGSAGLVDLLLAELAVVLVLAAIGFWSCRVPRSRAVLLVGLFGIAAAYSVFVGGDAWEYVQYANRYLTPVVPLLFVLAACGCREIVRWPPHRARVGLLGVGLVALLATVGDASLSPDVAGFDLRNDFNVHRLAHTHWLVFAVGVALFLGCALIIDRGHRGGAMALLATVLVIFVTLPAWTEWKIDAGHLVADSRYETKIGIGLRDAARGKPTIAVAAGGAIPYWSTLPAVDLLGKSDAVIAGGPNRRPGFIPGHTKWDYRYSICTLRPDLVTQLFQPVEADRDLIRGCGYTHIWDDFYIRTGSHGFDRQALSKLVFETH